MLQKNILREFFSQSLHPRKQHRFHPSACILGFDTEYDSKTQEILCWQLSYKGYGEIYYPPLNWDTLYQSIVDILTKKDTPHSRRKFRSFILATYWSVAEAQHLNILDVSVRIDEWGNGNYDFTKSFPSKNQTVRICDIQQWFRGMGLKDVAPMFGLRKLDYNVENVTKEDLNNPSFLAYAKNDAIITEDILLQLRALYATKYNVDVLKTKTPATTSAIIFLKDYLKEDIEQPDLKLRRLALLCSWGGNNQCFIQGKIKGKFKMYDANSMYPNSCIRIGKLPRKQDWIRTANLMDFLSSKNIGGVCKVGFNFPDNCKYPCLPVYSANLKALVYPLLGTSYCTLYEVRLARRLGAKLRLYQAYHFRNGVEYLTNFMKDMLVLKNQAGAEKNEPMRQMYKLNMNSIIGKFAQKTVKRDINDLVEYSHKQGIPLEHLVTFKNMPVSKRVNLGCIFYPEWNVLILGYARATIAEAFEKFEALIGTTDSLITDKPTPSQMKVNGINFELKKTGNTLVALRTRVYCLYHDTEIKYTAHHGIHAYKTQEKTREQFATELIERAVSQDWDGVDKKMKPFISYQARHIVLLREAIIRHLRFGQQVIDKDKKFYAVWDGKRKILGNGVLTRPLERIPDLDRDAVTPSGVSA